MPECDVVALAVLGEEAAQRQLFEAHWARAYRLAFLLLSDACDAEEVAQDAFVYAFRNIARFDVARASFWGWLRVIVVSRSRNKRRRHQLATVSLDMLDAAGQPPVDRQPAHDPAQWTEDLGARQAVWVAVQKVSQGAREALVLRYYEGLPYEQIAGMLGCSPEAARARVAYAKAQIRRQLEGSEGDLLEWAGILVGRPGEVKG